MILSSRVDFVCISMRFLPESIIAVSELSLKLLVHISWSNVKFSVFLFISISVCSTTARQCGGRVKTVEDKYEEERSKKKAHQEEKGNNNEILVDPVDVLPVKTLDGKLHYRTGNKIKALSFDCCLMARF